MGLSHDSREFAACTKAHPQIASAMRDVANHTSLADIILIRRLVSLHFLVPLPEADFIPVTWKVPRLRGHERSRGFFEAYDRAEDGRRELSGEWVVSAETARRWQNDQFDMGLMATGRAPHFAHLRHTGRQIPLMPGLEDPAIVVPDSSSDEDAPGRLSPLPQQAHYRRRAARMAARTHRVIYYIHGGAYYVGNAATHRLITIGVSQECRARVYGESLDMSLATDPQRLRTALPPSTPSLCPSTMSSTDTFASCDPRSTSPRQTLSSWATQRAEA